MTFQKNLKLSKLSELGSARDATGAYLIDRSPILFEPVLNYLRTNKLIYESQNQLQGILLEAEFYNLQVSSSDFTMHTPCAELIQA